MRKIFNYLFTLPIAVILIILSVANRQTVRFSLDPLNTATPALSVELPLFVFLFIAFLSGMLLGGLLIWISQGKHRKALREKKSQITQPNNEEESVGKAVVSRPEIAPGLPVATRV
ncbi:MAG: lipopolysaccharide assembly protein LapA domain-containing protein [Pseudomonadota bacterium]